MHLIRSLGVTEFVNDPQLLASAPKTFHETDLFYLRQVRDLVLPKIEKIIALCFKLNRRLWCM